MTSPGARSVSLKARALALLARRDYARAELRARLMRGAAPETADAAAVEAVLDELARLDYLSESRYAQALVRRRQGSRSRRAIEEELSARGVPPETVRAALAELAEDDDAALRALWARRFGEAPADEREKGRQVRFLQSRGFRLSDILKLLRELPSDAPGSE